MYRGSAVEQVADWLYIKDAVATSGDRRNEKSAVEISPTSLLLDYSTLTAIAYALLFSPDRPLQAA